MTCFLELPKLFYTHFLKWKIYIFTINKYLDNFQYKLVSKLNVPPTLYSDFCQKEITY